MNRKESFLVRNYLYIVVIYFLLFFIIRLLIGGALERDEAEQMLLFNNFSLGYGTQPPLYSWIEQIFFYIFKNPLVAIALLKNILLFIGYFFIYKSSYILTKNRAISLVAMASIFMVPPCSWECQRDLTHTVLAFGVSQVTLYYILLLRTKESFSIKDYLILSILAWALILSKYNMILYLFAFFVVAFFDKKLKRFLFDFRILLLFFILMLLLAPHLYWLYNNLSLAVDGTLNKLKGEEFSLFFLLKNYLLALVELFGLYIIIFFTNFRGYFIKGDSFLKRHQIVIIVLLFVLLVILQATNLKSRWLVVLLSPMFIFFATKLNSNKDGFLKRVDRFLAISIFFIFLIMSAYILRVVKPSIFHKNPRFNYPYQKLITNNIDKDFKNYIYTSSLSGGNIRYIYPNLKIKILKDVDIAKGSLIVLDKDTLYLKEQLESILKIKFIKKEAKYRYSNDKFILYFGKY